MTEINDKETFNLIPSFIKPSVEETASFLGTQGLVPKINTLRPRQNAQHFADDIFKRIFFNENVLISIKMSLICDTKGPINNIPALVQIMAWCRSGDKPSSEPMMVSLPTHICVTRPQWVKGLLAESLVMIGWCFSMSQRWPNILLKASCKKPFSFSNPNLYNDYRSPSSLSHHDIRRHWVCRIQKDVTASCQCRYTKENAHCFLQ